MGRYTEEEEELEYYDQHHPHPHGKVNPNQYPAPAGPARPPSAMDRIVNASKSISKKVRDFDQGPTGQAIRNHAQRLNSQSGIQPFTAGAQQQPQSRRSRQAASQQQPQQRVNPMTQYGRFVSDQPNAPPVHETSVMHPGNRIYVIQGTVIASGSAGPKQPQQQQPRRRQFSVGLGSGDGGFGNDRGL